MVFRPNFDVSISTRLDTESKDKFFKIALTKRQKPSELLREVIASYLQTSPEAALLEKETKQG